MMCFKNSYRQKIQELEDKVKKFEEKELDHNLKQFEKEAEDRVKQFEKHPPHAPQDSWLTYYS